MPNPMNTAPKDRNILILTTTSGYWNDRHHDTGTKWIEVYWKDEPAWGPPKFVPWCGRRETSTTEIIHKPLGWAELPE